MKIRVALMDYDPTALIQAWLDQGRSDWTKLPIVKDQEFIVGLPSVEIALYHLIDLAGGEDWISRHPDVLESLPQDVFHNAGGWLAARAQQDRFRFVYQGLPIGLTVGEILTLLGHSKRVPAPPIPSAVNNLDTPPWPHSSREDMSWESVDSCQEGGGFTH